MEVGDYIENGDFISFDIDGKKFEFEKISDSHAKSGHDIHERPINRLTNVLLNRDTMSKLGYVVHPNKTHILTDHIKKVKI